MDLFSLRGIGPARAEGLRAVGITSLRDLLFTLPVRYEDHSTVIPCALAAEGPVCVEGMIESKPVLQAFHGLTKVSVKLRDGSGTLQLQWFNAPWMTRNLHAGETRRFYGRLTEKNGRRVLQNPSVVTEPGWIPVYRPVSGFPAKSFRKLMEDALRTLPESCPETLPESFRAEYNLCPLETALRQVHFPESLEALRAARRRISFERMLLYLVFVSMEGSERKAAIPLEGCAAAADEYLAGLPFTPTGAQARALREIAADLEKPRAMARMVQGDVGCGKTAIAFGAIAMTVKAGLQSAMMAPTEILARQHYENALETLAPLGIRCSLLTGSTRAKERREILEQLQTHTCDAVFGTQALFSRDVVYDRLGLVITDEQHRFGVRQRSSLQRKGLGENETYPHVLVMSATPIPRSLALILYGDLDLTLVDELPAGRIPVKTRLVPEEKRSDLYRFVREEAKKGRQAYVVCPLVEEDENGESSAGRGDTEARSAKSVLEELTANELAGLRVSLTWGGQKSEEKAEVLRAFRQAEVDVLIATTVIEVGVNNPNATVMVVENAERFGLSQLHQLRGRVGRGSLDSWCFLLSDQSGKLRILTETNDGFEISRKDLELRGPGDLIGTRQSGEAMDGMLPDGDVRLLDEAARCVRDMHRRPEMRETLQILEGRARVFFAGREIGVN